MILVIWIIFGLLIGYLLSYTEYKRSMDSNAKYLFLGVLGSLSGVALADLWLGISTNFFSFVTIAIAYWITTILLISLKLFDHLYSANWQKIYNNLYQTIYQATRVIISINRYAYTATITLIHFVLTSIYQKISTINFSLNFKKYLTV